ncbi:M1 family metallopeptidase [Niabella sp. 22666]|uniref:M1 family metallopeptidase n=1 Tax=Niabella sp. 22666 TaxID=3453954 RepID=UPI003F841504
MRHQFLYSFVLALLVTPAFSQTTSVYNAKEAFNPQFYPYPGNEYRSASGEPGVKYWQNRADYKINCSIDTANHTVTGSQELVYTNNSPDNLKFLWLQLDQNIYRKDSRGSATTTASGGRWANTGFTQGQVIKSVAIEVNGKKYTPKFTITDTRMQVWLQESLKNAGKVKLVIDWSFEVPIYGTDRMGRLQTKNGWVYEIAQWFPRMCVYDDLQGWNVLPYVGQGEFYLEYGDIDFAVTAPADMIIVGSGELLNPSECLSPAEATRYANAKTSEKTVTIRSADEVNAGIKTAKKTNTWKFKIQNTRDAAWAASKAFVFDGAKINLPSGKKCVALSAYPVESIGTNGWQRSTEFTKASIEHYSHKWFEFPYPAATNVAGIVGGMEYPGIVFCGYRAKGAGLWGVTDHEFGHSWFPMIVGSNERKYAWMDEGFNTFINDFSTEAFNKGEFHTPSNGDEGRGSFSENVDGLYTIPDAVQQRSLGVTAYYKPSQMLHALRDNVLGAERFDIAFKEYINRWAFKHPSPWDFFHTMENVAGEDLSWFWRGWVFNTWKIDQAVKGVTYRDNLPANGAAITIENLEQMPMPVKILVTETNGKQQTIKLPVEIWQRGSSYTFTVPTTSELKEVKIDPDNQLPDWNRVNNTWLKK